MNYNGRVEEVSVEVSEVVSVRIFEVSAHDLVLFAVDGFRDFSEVVVECVLARSECEICNFVDESVRDGRNTIFVAK